MKYAPVSRARNVTTSGRSSLAETALIGHAP